MSLTYRAPTASGKTSPHTDTYHGRFVRLVPNERVVEVDQFETADPVSEIARVSLAANPSFAEKAPGERNLLGHDQHLV